MSAITSLASLLAMPVPLWLMLFAMGGLSVALYVSLARRLESHARSLGHVDRWADSVELRLEEMGFEGPRRTPIVTPPVPPRFDRRLLNPANDRRRRPNDLRELSDSEVRALLTRLVRAA